MFNDPKTEMEARFSMHYCIAVAMLRKRLMLDDFESFAVRDSKIRALYPKITMTKTSDNPLPTATGREPAETRVILKNGQTSQSFYNIPRVYFKTHFQTKKCGLNSTIVFLVLATLSEWPRSATS